MFRDHHANRIRADEIFIHQERHASLRGVIILPDERQAETQWVLNDPNTLAHDALEGLCADASHEWIFVARLKRLRLGRDQRLEPARSIEGCRNRSAVSHANLGFEHFEEIPARNRHAFLSQVKAHPDCFIVQHDAWE